MGYAGLHPAPELLLVPCFPALRWDVGGQYFNANTLPRQEGLEALSDVVFEREHRENLASAALAQFEFDLLYKAPLLRIRNFGIQIRRTRYQDALTFLGLRVVPEGREVPQTERLIWIQEQRIHAHAQNRLIASIRLERLLDIVFELFVSVPQRAIQLHRKHFFPV